VKVIAHNLTGKTTELDQSLTVAFRAPENLKATVAVTSLTVNVSATANYETFFKVYYGDSNAVSPIPSTSFLEGQTVTHNYANSGTYIVKVVALSGGAETTQYLDTITVSKPIDLPVTFDDPNIDYTLSDFGGMQSSVVADPLNPSNKVMKSIKTNGAETWAGVTIGTALGFATVIPIKANATKMSIMVYSPAAGIDVKLKIEDHNDGTHSVETDVLTTVANQWETLVFDFNSPATGTPALNLTYTYDKASVFFDFNNTGSGKIFYADNLKMEAPSLLQINLPVSFDDHSIDYTVTDFGGNQSSVVADPVNGTNNVMKSIKTSGAQTWAGTTIGTGLGFSSPVPLTASLMKMSARVYSPAAGIDVKLKIEDHNNGANSVETDVLTTVANQWETLTFDFSHPAANTPVWNSAFTYDKASVFFDFGNMGDGRVYYFDDLQMVPLAQINLPVTYDVSGTDYTVSDFGGDQSSIVPDPTNAGNNVLKSIKTAGSQTWAGTTIGTGAGFATAVPLTATSKMSVRVYSPAVGLDIKLKLEDHANGNNSIETDKLTTVANQWETLTFDFSQPASGTPAFNASFNYDKASLFFDFGNAGTGSVFYSDDLKFLN